MRPEKTFYQGNTVFPWYITILYSCEFWRIFQDWNYMERGQNLAECFLLITALWISFSYIFLCRCLRADTYNCWGERCKFKLVCWVISDSLDCWQRALEDCTGLKWICESQVACPVLPPLGSELFWGLCLVWGKEDLWHASLCVHEHIDSHSQTLQLENFSLLNPFFKVIYTFFLLDTFLPLNNNLLCYLLSLCSFWTAEVSFCFYTLVSFQTWRSE